MESFNDLRKYIIDNLDIDNVSFVATDNKSNTHSSVYILEKPKSHVLTSGNAIIIKFNQLSGGHVKLYNVEIRIITKDITTNLKVKDALVDLLDFYDAPCAVGGYVKLRFQNDVGAMFDETNNCYLNRLFFECRQIQ